MLLPTWCVKGKKKYRKANRSLNLGFAIFASDITGPCVDLFLKGHSGCHGKKDKKWAREADQVGSFWKPDETGWKFKVETVVVERSSYRDNWSRRWTC